MVKFPKQEMLDMIQGEESADFELIEDKIYDNSRWSIQHEIVFKHKGDLYLAWYQVGATEQQDERPWEWDKEVEAEKAKEVEVTIKKYVVDKDAK